MAKKLYEESSIQDIANAIRSQNGTHDAYTVAQMGDAVRAIKTQPSLEPLNATENGNYLPSLGKDGFSSVNVQVSDGGSAVVQPLSITQNGTYNPPSGVDGFAPVAVNVKDSGGPAKTAMLKVGQTHTIVPATNTIYSITNGAADYIVPVGENKSEVTLDLSQPFEICCKFKIANSPGATGRNIWGSINSYYYCPAMAVKDTQAEYYVTTNGFSWQHSGIAITPSGWTCPLDTWMIAKLSWDGSDFTFYFYDGTNEYSATLQNVTPYYNSNYRFCFGSQSNNTSYCIAACDASIDLAGTYLKQNNTKIWETTSSDGCSAVVQSLSVNKNGTYNPPSGVDGFAPVTVHVEGDGNDLYPLWTDIYNNLLPTGVSVTEPSIIAPSIQPSWVTSASQNVQSFVQNDCRISSRTSAAPNSPATRAITQAMAQMSLDQLVHDTSYFVGLVEYYGNLYDSQRLTTYNMVLLGDFSQGGSATGNTLSDAITNYSAVALQGIYQTNKASIYNSAIVYPLDLNIERWTGMKDRNKNYDTFVTFTDAQTVSLSGYKQVIIYGIP